MNPCAHRVGAALPMLIAVLAACGTSEQPGTPTQSASTPPTQAAEQPLALGENDSPGKVDSLAGLDALIGGLDPQVRPLEPWPLEAAPADWHVQKTDIPLTAGLTAIVAVQEPRGDYESVKQIQAIESDRMIIAASLRSGSVAGVKSLRARRVVSARDLAEAHGYRMTFSPADAETFPGMTALGVSSAVFGELQNNGRSKLDLHAGADLVGAMLAIGGALPSDLTGELVRASDESVGIAVLVNGRRTWLPALHAKGEFQGIVRTVPAEFWFLADESNPLTLRAQVDRARAQVVRIDFPAAQSATQLERALANREPVEMWGVYFEFASAQLQPESAGVMDQVAEVLRRHPDWRLRVAGHTDAVGNDKENLDLSRQRAETVRAQLQHRLGGDEDRIEAAGFGESRPRESNDTLSGRARNRRVELIRE